MIDGIDRDQVQRFRDKSELHSLSGQPIESSLEDPVHLMLESGILALAKSGMFATGDINYDLGDDIDYLADGLDERQAERNVRMLREVYGERAERLLEKDDVREIKATRLREAGWTRGRLTTSYVSFSESGFSHYIARTGKETSEAGETVMQHIGVNHQLTAIKPNPSETQRKAFPVRFRSAQHAGLVIFLQSGVEPNVELYAVEEVNENKVFARTRPDPAHAGWDAVDAEQLTRTDRRVLNDLFETFRRASEHQLLGLEHADFRFRLPLL